MVVLRLTDEFVANDPVCSVAPWAYLLVIGNDKNIIPSNSRLLQPIEQAITNGSPFQINLKPGFDFAFDDQIFQTLVQNATGGGNTEIVYRILHYVSANVVEVVTVEGGSSTTLTTAEILSYTAP